MRGRIVAWISRKLFGAPVRLEQKIIGRIQDVRQDEDGLHVTARIDDERVAKMLREGIGTSYCACAEDSTCGVHWPEVTA